MSTNSETVNETSTLLITRAVERGEFVTVSEARRPGLYGIGGPGPGGQILIVEHAARNLTARIDVSADGSFKVYPIAARQGDADEQYGFWVEILAA